MDKFLNRAATVAVIVAALCVTVVASKYLQMSLHGPANPARVLGKALPDTFTPGPHGALVLAVQTTCHFCTEGKPFYQTLSWAKNPRMRLLAALPQSQEGARAYLAGILVDDIVTAGLRGLGVVGTPTLMLIDSERKVKRVWVGKLDESREMDVLKAIGARS